MLQLHHISLPQTTVFLVVSDRKRCCAFFCDKGRKKQNLNKKTGKTKTMVTPKKGRTRRWIRRRRRRATRRRGSLSLSLSMSLFLFFNYSSLSLYISGFFFLSFFLSFFLPSFLSFFLSFFFLSFHSCLCFSSVSFLCLFF